MAIPYDHIVDALEGIPRDARIAGDNIQIILKWTTPIEFLKTFLVLQLADQT